MSDGAPYFFVSHASADKAILRPIFLYLMSKGVRLWIDKPKHKDLGFDPDEVAGYLRVGDEWDVAIQTAIDNSVGCLLFMSKNAVTSDYVKKEVALAVHERHVRTPRNYLFYGLFCDTFDTALMNPFFIGFLQPDELGLGERAPEPLPPQLIKQLDEIAAGLLKHAASAKPGAPRSGGGGGGQTLPPTEAPPARTRPIAYRANRRDQCDDAKIAFQEFRPIGGTPPKKRPLLLVYGCDADEPRHFADHSLPNYLVKKDPKRFFDAANPGEPVLTTWPGGELAAAEFRQSMSVEIGSKLLSATVDDSFGVDALLKALRSDQKTRVIATSLPADRGAKAKWLRSRCRAWIDYWDAFPFEGADIDGKVTLIPLLYVTLPPQAKRAPWTFVDRSAWRDLEDGGLERELATYGQSVRPVLLPRLGQVTAHCIDHWFDNDHGTFAGRDDAWCEDLRQTLMALIGDGSLAMRDWVQRSSPELAKVGL